MRIESPLRPIPGFEGLYSIAEDGRVWAHERVIVEARRSRRKAAHWLKPIDHSEGYLEVRLYPGDGTVNRQLVHRLVCEVFNGPPPAPGLLARHMDGDKQNNVPGNLAWGTYEDNAADAKRLGESATGGRNGIHQVAHLRRGENNPGTARKNEHVLAVFNDTGSCKDIAQRHGVSDQFVSKVKRGVIWSSVTGESRNNTGEQT